MKRSLGEEAAVVPGKCCGRNTAECWGWWRIVCGQHCASRMEAAPCTVARNLEFSVNSLLPMLTLWGFFCVCVFRELVFLIPWKQQNQCSAVWVLLVLLCAPESNEYKFKQWMLFVMQPGVHIFVFAYLVCVGQEVAICCFFVDVMPCFLLCCILRDQKPKQTTD